MEPPSTPPPPVEPGLPVATGQITDPSSDDRIMAALCHAAALIAGVIGPLVVYFAYKDRSTFVTVHALQALVFQAAGGVAIAVLGVLTCGLGFLLILPFWAASLYWALKAYEGERIPYPFLDSVGR